MTRDRVILALDSAPSRARVALLRAARRAGYRAFVGSPPIAPPAHESWYRWQGSSLVSLSEHEAPPRTLRTVRTPADLARVRRAGRQSGGLIIRWRGDRVIPLETLVADRARGGLPWVVADRPEELPAALGALEHGAARVLLSVTTLEELARADALIEPTPGRLRWTRSRLVTLRPVGVGERVIVDTTSLLDPREGLLVGSTARLLFHLSSEATGSSFSAPRPFRVNAGSPHLYVLMADGSTRYLSELAPGDVVAVARPGSAARAVTVGRVKIERRPMIMVGAAQGRDRTTVFVQEAETVRLSTPTGPVPVTDLALGTPLAGVRLPPARHLGREVEETIEER